MVYAGGGDANAGGGDTNSDGGVAVPTTSAGVGDVGVATGRAAES